MSLSYDYRNRAIRSSVPTIIVCRLLLSALLLSSYGTACTDIASTPSFDATSVPTDAGIQMDSNLSDASDVLPTDDTPGTIDDVTTMDASEAKDGVDSVDDIEDTANDISMSDDTPDESDSAPGEDAGPDTATMDIGDIDTDDDVDSAPEPCDPPLALNPTDPYVLAFELLTFQPSGGTGDYRITLQEDGSGGIVNKYTGAYLSGPTVDTQDIVVLEDMGCTGQAVVSVNVVSAFEVLPSIIEVPPETQFTFESAGGSGQVAFNLISEVNAPADVETPEIAVTPDGQVTLGSVEGTWEIEAIDLGLNTTRTATVTVSNTATVTAAPALLGVLPGSQVKVSLVGGSNVFDYTSDSDVVEMDGDWAVGISPGMATITATDHFTGTQTDISVHVLASAEVNYPRTGDNTSSAFIRTADIDQDGFDDIIFALREADVSGYQSGAVYVYRGTNTGPSPTPTQVLPGTERREEFGSALEVTDLTGDGRPDLVVGARLADINANDTGVIYVHEGLDDGTFETAPTYTLGGPNGGDQHGWSLAICDFNGDGRMDVASGAYISEDKDTSPQSTNQGAVRLWFGYDAGFNTDPDFAIFGQTVDTLGEWSYKTEMRLGWMLAAGDIDNDGNCDLVASALHWEPPEENGSWGAVFVYKGVAATDDSLGGLTTLPVSAYAHIDENDKASELGRALTVGDLNGDGFDDIGIGHWKYDNGPSSADHGAAWVIAGGPQTDAPATTFVDPEDVAAWSVANPNGYDYTGWDICITDVTGDGQADILVGSWQEELPGGINNTGTLAIYEGANNEWPSTEALWTIAGVAGNDRFAHTNQVVSDLNGDGAPEIATYAARNDDFGTDVGRPYMFWGQPEILGIEPPGTDGVAAEDGSDTADEMTDGDGVDGIESTDTTDSTDGTNDTDSGSEAEPTDATDGSGEADYSDAADSADSTDGGGKTDATDGADNTDIMDSIDSTDGVDSTDGSDSIYLPTEPFIALDMPDEPSGQEFGRGASVIPDVNGDGLDDLLVGAPNADDVMTNGGSAYLYLGIGGGFTTLPSLTFKQHTGHSNYDQFGYYVSTGGDFDGDDANDILVVARADDRANNLSANNNYEIVGDCSGSQNNVGAVHVFRGSSSGLPDTQPILVQFGQDPGQNMDIAEGGGDFNGDGYDDIAYGMLSYDIQGANNVGAFGLTFGRPQVEGKIIVNCTPDVLVEGTSAGNNFGRSLTFLGDIDGDGCDEVAAGSHAEDLGLNNQGTVRIFYGYNDSDPNTTCATIPRILLLRSGTANAQAGFSLDAGDVDNDGKLDLAVGGINLSVDGVAAGAAWVVPGAYLHVLEPEPFVPGETPTTHLFAPAGLAANLRVEGASTGENFGRSVAIVQGAGPNGRGVLVVGSPFGNLVGIERTGGARVYEFLGDGTNANDGLQPIPMAVVGGDMTRIEGRVGERVTGGLIGSVPVVVIAGFDGSAFGLDQGAAYIYPLPAGE